MNRYQIYLDPKSVDTADEMARLIDISRSQILRDVIDRVMREYKKIMAASGRLRARNNPLLKMAGFAKGLPSNLSQNIDEIYLRD